MLSYCSTSRIHTKCYVPFSIEKKANHIIYRQSLFVYQIIIIIISRTVLRTIKIDIKLDINITFLEHFSVVWQNIAFCVSNITAGKIMNKENASSRCWCCIYHVYIVWP